MVDFATLELRVARLEEALGGDPAMPAGAAAVGAMVRFAAFQMGLSAADILGPRRELRLWRARFAISYTAKRTLPHYSLPQIGRALGRRDHTTILNQVRRAEELRVTDPAFRRLTDRMVSAFTREETQP